MRISQAYRVGLQSGLAAALLLASGVVHAWGDEGHEIVGLIADHYLDPAVKQQINTLLATDSSGLVTPTDIAHEATWADKFRDSDRNSTKIHYNQTHNWHYVDIEIDGSATLDQACNQHPVMPAGTPASAANPVDCVVDKINQFAAELKDPATTPAERLMALEFVLHFTGDLHQPLHASDMHDQGGNTKKVSAPGIASGNLHAYWDTPSWGPLIFRAKSSASETLA